MERLLVQRNEVVDAHTLATAGKIAGSVAAAVTSLSPRHQRAIDAIQGDLAGLASKFVRTLAVEATRRNEAKIAGLEQAPIVTEPIPAVVAVPSSQRKQTDDFESMLIEDWAGLVAGSTYLEENLHIARSTLHRWQKRNDVVALRTGGRKHVFPLAQFVDGRPVAGISDVQSAITNPRLAWFWLTRPSAHLEGRVPLDMLRQDLVAEVAAAARAFSAG
nr:antitoxin Xre/MbcA/ParS toxin-binding domain-containing protein [Mesorhizobium sp. PAMC28654]